MNTQFVIMDLRDNDYLMENSQWTHDIKYARYFTDRKVAVSEAVRLKGMTLQIIEVYC